MEGWRSSLRVLFSMFAYYYDYYYLDTKILPFVVELHFFRNRVDFFK